MALALSLGLFAVTETATMFFSTLGWYPLVTATIIFMAVEVFAPPKVLHIGVMEHRRPASLPTRGSG